MVKTVVQMGWAGIKNGQLLALAQNEFDVFVTVDRALPSQQHLAQFKIAVLVLAAPSNRFNDLQPVVPKLLAALPNLKVGESVTVAA